MALDANVLEELKQKLLGEKTRLEAELGRFANPTGGAGQFETNFENIGTDPDENATEVENYTDNLALEGSLETQLGDVLVALEKMEKGTYGICEKTGEEIPLDRLRAYPEARTTITA